ncbi:MAG: PqqD family protein [Halobacteriovoraceae bacterium]|jgi:hypothetical protein|nr:PqqD family protein [Halobacteriovoraceae bacterium]MBT5094036.1 PqqD family protein [Halobacteriovoraceae bacterium]
MKKTLDEDAMTKAETTTDFEATLKVAEDIISRKNQDGSVVLMKMNDSELFYKIDGIAAEVWHQIEASVSLKDIMSELTSKHQCPENELAADVDKFAQELLRLDMVSLP